VHLAKPNRSDEVERLPGSGRLRPTSCCRQERSTFPSRTALKERAAASVFEGRSPHRSSCRRHPEREIAGRRPSTEIRLGVDSALGESEPSLLFLFVLRAAVSS
jgi:hypothetical protein